MGVRIPLGLFFMTKRQKILKLDSFGILLILVIIGAFAFVAFSVWYFHGRLPVLNGPVSEDFCIKKCSKEDNYVFSINDSNLEIIKCDCIYSASIEASPYSGVREVLEEKTIYFDSVSLEEISYDEVIGRFTSAS